MNQSKREKCLPHLHAYRRLAPLPTAALPPQSSLFRQPPAQDLSPQLPPCISSDVLHQAWLLEQRVYVGEVEAAYPDVGGEHGA